MIKFYTDVHIAREAVDQFRKKGVDIIHYGEVGMSDADDRSMLDIRNAAAHDERLERGSAEQMRAWAFGILGRL